MTLNHFDMPLELEEEIGGCLNPEIRQKLCYVADACFKSFGDRLSEVWFHFR